MLNHPTLTVDALNLLNESDHPPVTVKPGWLSLSGTLCRSISMADEISIPEFVHSLETLEFMGFESDIAQRIWRRYQDHEQFGDGMITFMDFVRGYIQSCPDAYLLDHQWDEVMKEMGVTKKLRDGILTEGFDDIRLSGTAASWVLKTMEDLYQWVSTVSKQISAAKSRAPSQISSSRCRQESASSNESAATDQLPSFSEHDKEAAEPVTILFKGGSVPRLQRALSTNDPAKRHDLSALVTFLPADFGFGKVYFTRQRQLALRYAMYAQERERMNNIQVGILHLEIPTRLLADAREIYGQDWKRFVWGCRRCPFLPPLELDEFDNAGILIGPIWMVSEDAAQSATFTVNDVKPYSMPNGVDCSQHAFRLRKCVEVQEESNVWIEQLEALPQKT
ncbi:hypothetical protein L228DRAFT_26732 [Xylona heveae TC161]|uniref:EF-hand domain-containing protein n=1 Tax=Xylona heveae (strain CBS 132557 / TC161) TaxID=1328760 RepID=A0A165AEY0_XYLHT|nr:hypothetical protein L228DRAFT_26732 [Xylona heveae TC161]KZF20365.1 hypothetical protein L228DRAFT_26732 [Xylona heveae TC161]